MSFLSQHIAKETGQDDPVLGPNSPHAGQPHHGEPGGPAHPQVLTSGGNPAPKAPEEDTPEQAMPKLPRPHRFFGKE